MSEREWRKRARRVLARPLPPSLRTAEEVREHTPWFFAKAEGARVIDEDGREFLDLEMGRGPHLIGYGHPVMVEAILGHARCGGQNSRLHRAEVETAELLSEMIDVAEQVVFAKNGSDACTGAVRIARAATGREVVLSSGFHGFQDWFAPVLGVRGIPCSYGNSIASFALNDRAALDRLSREHASNLAAIIIEPAHREMPAPGFLEEVRKTADRTGALLIFDEVVTAFRLHKSGATGMFGVSPDLICLGKAMANGFPLSAVGGTRRAMRHLDSTYFSMTYRHDSMAFAVARACLDHIRQYSVSEVVNDFGGRIRRAFDEAASVHGSPARALGFPGRLDLMFPEWRGLDTATQESVFRASLLDCGVLPCLSVFSCEMLTEDDMAQAGMGFRLAFERLAGMGSI